MSSDLEMSAVCKIMYHTEGYIYPGDEEKVRRYEQKIAEWKRDVFDKKPKMEGAAEPTKKELADEFWELENSFSGYWCEGEECMCKRTHWVIHASVTTCWECMHDPCACRGPLVWDEVEKAYYRFFLSCDGKTKKNVWMTEPASDMERVVFHRGEKKRKERQQKEDDEENCHDNQQQAKEEGFCCHQHATEMKKENEEKKIQKEKSKKLKRTIDGPDHCIHCDEDPCVFVQIEARLCNNDAIYYDSYDYKKDPTKCNSGRRKRAFQYAAYILWEGINYRKPHFACVEAGVRALFPPFDGKIMGFKKK
jgi:hypothetical protein